jgi:Na+-driven multidrug efflux pump
MKYQKSINYLNDSFTGILVKLGTPIVLSGVLAVFLTVIKNNIIRDCCPRYFTVYPVLSSFLGIIVNISSSVVNAAWVRYAVSFASQSESRNKNLANTVSIVIVCQLMAEAVALIFADPILHLMNTPAEIYRDVKTFYILNIALSIFTALSCLMLTLCNGLESSLNVLLMNIVNQVAPCVLLIVLLRVFNFGLVGSAVFGSASAAVVAIICLVVLLRNKRVEIPAQSEWKPDLREFGYILKSAGLIFLQTLLCSAGYIAVDAQTNRLLPLEYISVLSVNIPIATAFSAFSTIVSVSVPQNYFAQKHERTRQIVGKSFFACQLYGVCCFLIYWLAGKPYFATIFTDQTMIDMGASFWFCEGIGYLVIPTLYVIRFFFVAVNRADIALGAGFAELAGNLLCAYVVIPYFGEIGRSAARATGWGMAMLYLWICYFVFRNRIFPKVSAMNDHV